MNEWLSRERTPVILTVVGLAVSVVVWLEARDIGVALGVAAAVVGAVIAIGGASRSQRAADQAQAAADRAHEAQQLALFGLAQGHLATSLPRVSLFRDAASETWLLHVTGGLVRDLVCRIFLVVNGEPVQLVKEWQLLDSPSLIPPSNPGGDTGPAVVRLEMIGSPPASEIDQHVQKVEIEFDDSPRIGRWLLTLMIRTPHGEEGVPPRADLERTTKCIGLYVQRRSPIPSLVSPDER